MIHHARTGNAHVNDPFCLAHAVESAGHEGVVLHGVAEHHQLGAAKTVPVRRPGGGILDDAAHELHGIHIDAGTGGANVDAGAHQLRPVQGLRNGADQLFVGKGHSLLHQCGIAADKVDAAGLCRPVQRHCEGYIVLRLAGSGHQSHGGHGDPLVHNGDPEFMLDVLAGLDQLFRIPGDFLVDLVTGLLRIGIAAAQEGNTHGDGADV